MTSIEWTDRTWNPVRGCSVISAGCRSCYAMKQAHRFSGEGGAYEGLTQLSKGGPVWTGKVRLVPEVLDAPLRWRKPQRIFVNSMSDLFHENVPDGFIMRVLDTMAHAPRHTFQILTKRAKRMRDFFTRWSDLEGEDFNPKVVRGPDATRKAHASGRGQLFASMLESMGEPPDGYAYPTFDWMDGMITWPRIIPNVHLGVSAEDQERADERIPLLLQTPAAVRFVSAEPLLGPLDFTNHCRSHGAHGWSSIWRGNAVGRQCLDWIIIGGESGPGARCCDVQWIYDVVRDCRAAKVPVFVKQLGSCAAYTSDYREWFQGYSATAEEAGFRGVRRLKSRKGGDPAEWPADLRVREFPETR